ncbi:TniQ family protein [Streptomyces sp. NPDC090088]|uniref:TniQ family protein n=1 Tax=Streptomyces sp. NPDC090088 TaxID=3365944 RepID=UPI0038071999
MNTHLPRSLVPHPDELLPGYLLRLSDRLATTPLAVAERCGLATATGKGFSTAHLVRLDDDHLSLLTQATRLTVSEAHRLTLAGQFPGYPPVGRTYLGRPRRQSAIAHDGWVFTSFSRYCPDCLAAEQPVWKAAWRLPHLFWCPDHRRLLHWRCPACHAPAFSAGPRDDRAPRPAHLVPAPEPACHPPPADATAAGPRTAGVLQS